MPTTTVTAAEIEALSERVITDGYDLPVDQARALLDVEPGSDAYHALLAAACRVRDHHHGISIKACSILNAKAGNCSEDCSFCSQSKLSDNVDYDKHKWLDNEIIDQAASTAADNGARALGLVAAWKGVKEGSQLDMVCESVRKLSDNGSVRADVNLGILENQNCADRLYDAGARVYGHNLETARSFYDSVCTTHDFDERMQTIDYIKQAGMGLCSGGIIGLGENREQRIEFAEQLRFIEPDMIPINFLNPLEGTKLAEREVVDCDEALITLAVYRLMLPLSNIMVAGGKEVTFGDRLAEVYDAGINAVMVGNYLTSMGTSPDFWHEEAAKRGLSIAGDGGCGSSSCGC
ncbi:MAG: biotin synthase BioB [Planctomycetota bacterium]|jgi:biotin synthase